MTLFKYNKYKSIESSHLWLDNKILSIIKNMSCKDIIDIGCGNGNFVSRLYKEGHKVTGIDAELSGIEIARKNYKNINFFQYSIYDNPSNLKIEKADLITSIEVIEHLFKPDELLIFSKHFLKSNGKLILSTPYYGSYIKNLFCSIFNKWDDQFTVLWDGGHIKFFSLKTLRKILEKSGFKIVSYKICNKKYPFLNHIWPHNIIIIAELQN